MKIAATLELTNLTKDIAPRLVRLWVVLKFRERLAAAGRFHFAVGDLGDFEFGGDGLGNAFEFARFVEGVDEIAEGIKSHTPAKPTETSWWAIAGVSTMKRNYPGF